MDETFDLERFRLTTTVPTVVQQAPKVRVRRQQQPFLRGPIPMPWLRAAAQLRGQALYVGIEIWFQVGLRGQDDVQLNLSRIQQYGISRSAASRGLAALETAGLVCVDRHQGRKSTVRVIRKNVGTENSNAPTERPVA